jgi:hypothetical protein
MIAMSALQTSVTLPLAIVKILPCQAELSATNHVIVLIINATKALLSTTPQMVMTPVTEQELVTSTPVR